jgi:curved DNA-binding protein CbpA
MNHISIWLRNIHFNRKTGRLIFKSGDIEKKFFFQKGRLVQVKTNQAAERLGNILFRLGKITREKQETLGRDLSPTRALGEVLVGSGVITPRDLDEALVVQMKETVLNTFPFHDADFVFHPQDDSSPDGDGSGPDLPSLIESGIRGMPYHETLKLFLAGKVFSAKSRDLARLLPPEDIGLLDLFNGKATAESVRAGTGLDPESFWRRLLILYCLDMVDVRKRETTFFQTADFEPPAPEVRDSANEQDRIAEILAFRDKIAALNFYRILGVPRNATEQDIKKAYFHLARKYHPDRLGPELSADYRSQIDDIFQTITTAYKTLVGRDTRRAYDGKMDIPASGPEDVQAGQKRADVKFRQGKTLYNQGRYEEAAILLEEAVRLKKDKGDFFLLLALTQNRLPGKGRKAEENFLKAIALEPWNPEGYVGLGYLYKKEDMTIKALRQFQKAVELDPDHRTAAHEVELLGGLRGKKKLFGFLPPDLFKKPGKTS